MRASKLLHRILKFINYCIRHIFRGVFIFANFASRVLVANLTTRKNIYLRSGRMNATQYFRHVLYYRTRTLRAGQRAQIMENEWKSTKSQQNNKTMQILIILLKNTTTFPSNSKNVIAHRKSMQFNLLFICMYSAAWLLPRLALKTHVQ